MNESEKATKKFLKQYSDNLFVDFDCACVQCEDCPLIGIEECYNRKEMLRKTMDEVWAETHGYVKNKAGDKIAEMFDGHQPIVETPYKYVDENGNPIQLTIDPELKVESIDPWYIKTESDPINPNHYKAGEMQVIEQMMLLYGPKAVADYCRCNAFKYHGRAGLKGSAEEDHRKADWHMRLYEKIRNYKGDEIASGMIRLKEFLKEEETKK